MKAEQLLTMDVHSRECEIGVFVQEDGEPRQVAQQTVQTSIPMLARYVTGFPGRRTLVFEEGTMAAWLRRSLARYFTEIVVCDPKHNQLIYEDLRKGDRLDPKKLATLYWAGALKPVYHTDDLDHQTFKELVLHYHDVSRTVVRYKNKIKAMFQQHGHVPCGSRVYSEEGRRAWQERLQGRCDPMVVRHLYELMDEAEAMKSKLKRRLAQRAKAYAPIARFQAVSAVGLITAATFFAIVDTPWRFPSAKHLWHYSGLAAGRKTSAGKWLSRAGLLPEGNRLLRYVLLQAATTLARCRDPEDPFSAYYRRIREHVQTAAAARNTVARKVAAVLWGMWKSGRPFDATLI